MRELDIARTRREAARRLATVAVALAIYAALTAALYRQMSRPGSAADAAITVVEGSSPPSRNIAVKDGWFWVDGAPFFVRSVGWDPVRPGELPWQRQLDTEELSADLERIRAAGFNTIRTWAPLGPEELALVSRHGLRVLQGVWVDPAGDFADPAFRRRTLAEVGRAVERSRWSPAILGYLVLNEPRAAAVARAGLEETRAFLRELAATVRALDPSAPVGYASWPGMEALDDPLLDFVAFNVYPHRPRVVMDELGLQGYVAMLRDTVAAGRPLIISEYGISVSPHSPVPGRGGATEAEQAETLLELSSTYVGSGAVGLSVFQWSDGWWKNNEQAGDESSHDPKDPEEWFGLVAYEGLEDRIGTPRPALEALTRYQRAILVEPRHGPVERGPIPVAIVAEEPVKLEVSVNGGPRYGVELWSAGGHLWRGKLMLPGAGTREDVELILSDASGEEIGRERRLLRTAGPRGAEIAIEPGRLRVAPGEKFEIAVRASGAAARGGVSVATFTEDRFNEDRVQLALDEDGRARATFEAPDEETVLTLLAFEDDPALPPAERASSWAVVEVRK